MAPITSLEDAIHAPGESAAYLFRVAKGRGKRKADILRRSRYDNLASYVTELLPQDASAKVLSDLVFDLRLRARREPSSSITRKIDRAVQAVQEHRNDLYNLGSASDRSSDLVNIALGRGDRHTQYVYHDRIDYLSSQLETLSDLSANEIDDLRIVRAQFVTNRYLDGKQDDMLQDKRTRLISSLDALIDRESTRLYLPQALAVQSEVEPEERPQEPILERDPRRPLDDLPLHDDPAPYSPEPTAAQEALDNKERPSLGAISGRLARPKGFFGRLRTAAYAATAMVVGVGALACASLMLPRTPTEAELFSPRYAPTPIVEQTGPSHTPSQPSAIEEPERNYPIIGEDNHKGKKHGRADALMVINIRPDSQRLNVISIPRDSKVRIPGRTGMTKINHANAYGGPELQVATVEEFMGININGYVSTDPEGFKSLYNLTNELLPLGRVAEETGVSTSSNPTAGEALEGLRNRQFANAAVGRANNIGAFTANAAARGLEASASLHLLVRSAAIRAASTILNTNVPPSEIDALVSVLQSREFTIRAYSVPGRPNDWPRTERVSYWLTDTLDDGTNAPYADRVMDFCDAGNDCRLVSLKYTPPRGEPIKDMLSLDHKVRIGNTNVGINVYERSGSETVYVNMHDNEQTSVDAARRLVDEQGGRLVDLRYSDTARRIKFQLNGKSYEFEPNGMFTDAGIERSLRMHGDHNYSEEAHAAVRQFAQEVVDISGIGNAPLIVALHNNWNGSFSANSYAHGDSRRIADAASVHLSGASDHDDFFFVTDQGIYDSLQSSGFSVVLQDNSHALDDGSLSIYAARIGIPYVNSEAQHGHLAEQVRMLSAIPETSRPQPMRIADARISR